MTDGCTSIKHTLLFNLTAFDCVGCRARDLTTKQTVSPTAVSGKEKQEMASRRVAAICHDSLTSTQKQTQTNPSCGNTLIPPLITSH